MKRGISLSLAIFLCLAVLGGCGGSKDVDLDVNALADRLATELTYEDQLTATNDEMIQLLYGTQAADVTKAKVYLSAGATTEEIAVFECKDANAAETVKAAVEKRIEAQKTSVQSYKPEELSRLEEALVQIEGRYVIFSVSNDKEAVQKMIDEAIGK